MTHPAIEPLEREIDHRIRRIATRARVPGVAVGIVIDQQLAWSGGFGFADIDARRPPDSDTLFRCGSITKTFTASAIVQLQDEGKLRLDEPVVRYLPEFSAVRLRFGTTEDITLRRMLTHHSGLMSEGPKNGWDTGLFPTINEMLGALPETEVTIEPDSAMKYSNLAYSLLGEVVTRVSGVAYAEYVRVNLLEPLGMTSSSFDLAEKDRARAATGYVVSRFEDLPQLAPTPHLRGFSAAGQLCSSVADLSKWISLQFRTEAAHRAGSQVLKGSSLRAMLQPYYMEEGWNDGYCLGWMASRRGDDIYHHHGGGIQGFYTAATFNQRDRIGVVVLTNASGHPATFEIAYDVHDVVTPTIRDFLSISAVAASTPVPEEYRSLLGSYERPDFDLLLNVVWRGGRLVLVDPASPSAAPTLLSPTANPHVFEVESGRSAGEPLEFRLAPEGKVASFLLNYAFPYYRLRSDKA